MRSKSVIIGLCFIVLGVLIGLASFDIIDFDLFFPGWWTLFIIVPSVMGLICDGDKTWSLVGLFIGTFFFLFCLQNTRILVVIAMKKCVNNSKLW